MPNNYQNKMINCLAVPPVDGLARHGKCHERQKHAFVRLPGFG